MLSFHLNYWLNNWNCSFQLLVKPILVLTWWKGSLCFWKVRKWKLSEKICWWRDLHKKPLVDMHMSVNMHILIHTYIHTWAYVCLCVYVFIYIYMYQNNSTNFQYYKYTQVFVNGVCMYIYTYIRNTQADRLIEGLSDDKWRVV